MARNRRAVTTLWACNTWLEGGAVLHLLGATLMVTLFDWALALIAVAAITVLAALAFDAPWNGVALTFLAFGAFPVGISALLQRAAIAWLPRSRLIFIAWQGFVLPVIATVTTACLALGTRTVLAGGTMPAIPAGYALNIFLLASREMWFTGMLTILITIYRPVWITTCDISHYRFGGPHT